MLGGWGAPTIQGLCDTARGDSGRGQIDKDCANLCDSLLISDRLGCCVIQLRVNLSSPQCNFRLPSLLSSFLRCLFERRLGDPASFIHERNPLIYVRLFCVHGVNLFLAKCAREAALKTEILHFPSQKQTVLFTLQGHCHTIASCFASNSTGCFSCWYCPWHCWDQRNGASLVADFYSYTFSCGNEIYLWGATESYKLVACVLPFSLPSCNSWAEDLLALVQNKKVI